MCRVFPGHERRSGRSAEGRHVVAVENDSVIGQRVNVWRWDLGRAMETHVIPTLDIKQPFEKNLDKIC
jgi:hypothetical protein